LKAFNMYGSTNTKQGHRQQVSHKTAIYIIHTAHGQQQLPPALTGGVAAGGAQLLPGCIVGPWDLQALAIVDKLAVGAPRISRDACRTRWSFQI
jgi:hypothetical protein